MNLILTAIYTSNYKRVSISYMMDNAHEFVACGEVSDDEVMQLIAAEGGNVDGWSVEIK